MEEEIAQFLNKLDLEDYLKDFTSDQCLHPVKNIQDFKVYLGKEEALEALGLTDVEVKRFIRMCKGTIHEIRPNDTHEVTGDPEQELVRIRYRILSPTHIQYCKNDILQVPENTPYYGVITQLYEQIKPSLEYECESIELYNETGYPLVTIPAYYLYPIQSWLLRSEDLVFAIPKALQAPSIINKGEIKHIISIQTTNEEIKLEIEIRTAEKDNIEITGLDIKQAISLHIHIPVYCIYLYFRPSNHRFPNQLEDSKTLTLKSIKEKKTIVLFDLSEEYWSPTSLDTYSSELTRPCNIQPNEYHVLHTFNAELMYFARVLASRSKEDQLLFLGSLRKISCSPPLVYAFLLLSEGNYISLPHKIAILEGVSTVLSFAVENKNSILCKFPLFARLCAFVEKSSTPGDRSTEQYEHLYLPARTRRRSTDDNIKRLSMSFPDEQKEMIIWSSVRRVNQKFNTKINLDNSINFPYKHPVELMFDYMHNRIENGLMVPLNKGKESAVVFTGGSNEPYKYLKYYSPLEGKAITFHPHDFSVVSDSLTEDLSHCDVTNTVIVLLDISNEMIRTDLHSSQGLKNKRTDKSGCTQIAAGIILINTIIDRLIRQETNYLLGLFIFSNDRPELEYNRFLVTPTLSYNDIVIAMDATLQFLIRPSIANQVKTADNMLTEGIEYCNGNYPNSNIICITNQSEANETAITSSINCMVVFGGKNGCDKLKKKQVGMLINEKKIDLYISNEQDKVMNYPFSEWRLVEYIDLIENHIRIANNFEFALQSPNFKEFNDYEEQLQMSGDKYMSTSTPEDIIAVLKEITLYMHNPNPYAKMFSNGSLKDWSITFDFHGVIPNIELLMHLPLRYPLVPPKFRLLCRIHHCNVDKHGYVCHPILFEGYQHGITLRKIIDAIYNMLITPIPSHAVQTKEVLLYYSHSQGEVNESIFSSSFVSNKLKVHRSQSAKTTRDTKLKCPEYLTCSLTSRVFENPVITPDGHTYDRDAIILYINLNHKDPISGNPLTEEDLTANKSIADGVAKYKRGASIEKYWWEQKL
ncbi:hypothetical protein LOD99_725 [Oopsacas minuta]|uniref:RING-type E3 ubiquitin transferase n=1 Tax=Oopsacas minuta TaxID=111878 RepID=A0AAV7JZK9_9METZ|nr:hypothetical protein LOD99_725 [Oopsacas minuta]